MCSRVAHVVATCVQNLRSGWPIVIVLFNFLIIIANYAIYFCIFMKFKMKFVFADHSKRGEHKCNKLKEPT